MNVAVSSRGFDVSQTYYDVLQAKSLDDVMVNSCIAFSRVFTAMTPVDNGVAAVTGNFVSARLYVLDDFICRRGIGLWRVWVHPPCNWSFFCPALHIYTTRYGLTPLSFNRM